MKNKIEEIKIEEAFNIVHDKVVFNRAKKDKITIFKIEKPKLNKEDLRDSLLDLEITLRKCKRVGVFRN